MLPLNTPEALAALGHSAMLLSLGASPLADEYESLVKQLPVWSFCVRRGQ